MSLTKEDIEAKDSCVCRSRYFWNYKMQKKNGSGVLTDLSLRWAKSNFDNMRGIRLVNMYGKWGITYAFRVGPFLSLIPLLVLVLMFIVFKRKNLLGVTQKFILSIIGMNACCTTTSAVRDTLLLIFQKHYGFLEFSVCEPVIFSLRLQTLFINTAAWLNTLMLLHQVILVGFPLKAKFLNFSVYLYVFLFFHAVFTFTFVFFLNYPSFQPLPLIQDFQPGYPLKVIEGCVIYPSTFVDENFSSNFTIFITYVHILYSKLLPLTLHFITTVTLSVLISKQIRILKVLLHNMSVDKIKYVMLLKVNVGLGISFIFQELPILVILLFQFHFNTVNEEMYERYTPYLGIATTAMSVSYCVGKPIDLLIYACLSKAFKDELKLLLVGGCKPGRKTTQKNVRPEEGPPNKK